ncbi:hypothetical protein HDU76_003463 [Blyttiomyces sp. JEL0837]|nr:hypothetical protein HDU76_003463 [Blyttiomyces sp. JEL0837]
MSSDIDITSSAVSMKDVAVEMREMAIDMEATVENGHIHSTGECGCDHDQVSTPTVSFTITYKGTHYPITLPTSTTLHELQSQIESITDIPISNQKLLHKSIPPSIQSDKSKTLWDLNIPNGSTIMLVGSTANSVKGVLRDSRTLENKKTIERKQQQLSSSKKQSESFTTSSKYTFQSFQVLPNFPDSSQALALLHKLSSDPGVRAVMENHKWSVGALIELSPSEESILGYNRNRGEVIALRLRTNDLDGFRHFGTVRKVLMHELAHMVFGDHDNNFHELNSKLNSECERHSSGKSLTQGGARGPLFNDSTPSSTAESGSIQGGTFVLGGNGENGEGSLPMREVLARAVARRLTKEEVEMVEGCGTLRGGGQGVEKGKGKE